MFVTRESVAHTFLYEFKQMNDENFYGSSKTRFTLFRPVKSDPKIIEPWYRFHSDTKNDWQPFEEAKHSTVRYERDHSLTGRTWSKAGSQLFFMWLPDFEGSRTAFSAYYENVLGIPASVVQQISDYMIGVQAILSYGFTNAQGDLLSVLSLDLRTRTYFGADGLFFELEGRPIGMNALAFSFRRLQKLLEAFRDSDITI